MRSSAFRSNPECDKIRSTVGERALGGDFMGIYSAFYSEAKTAEEKRGRMKGFSAESLMEKRVVHQLR